MAFNPDNKRYFEITETEKRDMLLTGGSLSRLKEARIKKYGAVEPLYPELLENNVVTSLKKDND